MTSLSTRRPLFLSTQQRRKIQERSFLIALFILTQRRLLRGIFSGRVKNEYIKAAAAVQGVRSMLPDNCKKTRNAYSAFFCKKAERGCSMTSLSNRRPLFLSGQQRRRIQARRFLIDLFILAPMAFASGYFFCWGLM